MSNSFAAEAGNIGVVRCQHQGAKDWRGAREGRADSLTGQVTGIACQGHPNPCVTAGIAISRGRVAWAD